MTAITNEAMRYLENAKEILKTKARKDEGLYLDKKYVKMAGHTAYSGVLYSLDELLRGKKKERKSVEWYQEELSNIDRKITSRFAIAYQILHLDMGYDGTQSAKLAQLGLDEAEKIIEWVDSRLN